MLTTSNWFLWASHCILPICCDLQAPSYSLIPTASANRHWTTWAHEQAQLHCTALLTILTPKWLNSRLTGKLNCLHSPVLHSNGSSEHWVYLVSDSFCQIFFQFITLSAPQLQVTFQMTISINKLTLCTLLGIKGYKQRWFVFQGLQVCLHCR